MTDIPKTYAQFGPQAGEIMWKMHQAVTRIEQELAALMVRLEVRHDGGPDGIECRDETIKMQDDEIARLRAEVEALKVTLYRVRRAAEDLEDAGDYMALQNALRGEEK